MKKSPVIIDEKSVNELLSRGVENIYPDRETLKKKLMSGERLRLYCGFDPNSPTLHIGHGITIKKLSHFQKLGHQVIFLFGDFTGQIGDPDKLSVRQQITHKQVLNNLKGWKKQIKNIIDINKLEFKFNSKWLAKLNFTDLISIAKNFTAQQMMDRDMFKERIKIDRPVYLHEFFYPLMQAYDSVVMDVDLEIGGNDQTFNMLAGRTLMKAMKGKEKLVLTTKLLEDPTGKKMGKSEGNMIALTDSPEEMFGKVMSWTDGMIVPALEIITDVPMEMVRDVAAKLKDGSLNPRDAKLDLAYEVVKIYLGEAAAQKGRENFKRVVQNKEKPEEIPEIKINLPEEKIGVLDLFVAAGLAKSNGEVRRLIAEKALRIDDALIELADLQVEIPAAGLLLQRGKRQFARAIKK